MEYIALIKGFFTFFDQVVALIKLLQKSPASRRQKLLEEMKAELTKIEQGGRPEWD
jgi:hypothetical protein